MRFVQSLGNSVSAAIWPGMPEGFELGRTPTTVWAAFKNQPLAFMAHFWAMFLITFVLFSVALLFPIGAYLLWRQSRSWISAWCGSNKKKKKIIVASLLLCDIIIVIIANNNREKSIVETQQSVSNLNEQASDSLIKTQEEYSTLFSFLLLRHKEIPLEALLDSVRLIDRNLMELAADVDMNEFKDIVENQKEIHRALSKLNSEADTIRSYRAQLQTVLAELEEISAQCPNCNKCPPKAFFHAYVDFTKIPAYIQGFIEINNMIVKSETTPWVWEEYGPHNTSQYLSKVLREAELNLTKMIPSIESQWKEKQKVLSEKISRAGEKQKEELEQFSNPILQWLDVNYTTLSIYTENAITMFLLATVICHAIGMIIICLEEKLIGWLHSGRIAIIASSCRKIYVVVAIPLMSVTLAMIGTHIVASTLSHNTVCDDVGLLPMADGLEIGEFELKFNDICSSLAQNLREKLATIQIDSYDYRWENENKEIYWSMTTSDWYLKIMELNVELQNENMLSTKNSDARECWDQAANHLHRVQLQDEEKHGNASPGPKINDHDLLTYSLLKQEFVAMVNSSETLRNLSFNPPFWKRQVDFLIRQTDKVVKFQQQSPNVLRELFSTFERKCKFLLDDLYRDVAKKVPLKNTSESTSSLRAAPKELFCNDVYGSLNESWMSLMFVIIFMLPSLMAALFEKNLLEIETSEETPEETPDAETNAVEESSF